MSQYYFTVASLPLLTIENKPSITIEDFLSTCSLHVKTSDFNILKNSSIKIPEDESVLTGVAKVCWDWEKSLRNELSKLRAVKMNVSADEFIHPGDVIFGTQNVALESMKIESPLEAENFLNVARFSFIDSLNVGHYFDLTFLVLYYLKLQILDRISNFDSTEGYIKYQNIYKNILTAYEAEGSEI